MFSFLIFTVIIVFIAYTAFILKSATLLLLVFVLACLWIYAAVSTFFQCRKIKVQIQIPIQISEKGRENLVKIKTFNQGKRPIFKAKARFMVKDILSGKCKKYQRKLPIISVGENDFAESLVFGQMGKYEVRLTSIRVYDLTGLFYMDLKCEEKGSVQVMPGMYEVPVLRTEATRNYYGEAETFDTRFPGYDNSEIFRLREYRNGDRIQNVHWKLTAKQEELVVKEHSMPKPCPVVLFLDYKSKKKGVSKIAFMEVAAGISFSVMNAGCPHYVVWYDRDEKDVVRIRVDDEESMFYFIGILTDISWGNYEEKITEQYHDKYRNEEHVRIFVLDETLTLRDDKTIIGKISAKQPEKSMSEIELIL